MAVSGLKFRCFFEWNEKNRDSHISCHHVILTPGVLAGLKDYSFFMVRREILAAPARIACIQDDALSQG
jgi:hypothetical protein